MHCLSSGGQKPEILVLAGWLLLRAVGENLLQACPLDPGGLLAIFGAPWLLLHPPHLCLQLYMGF